jgi:predicted phosphodiesterase
MRYAILSDIHANLEALTAVLEAIDSEGVHKIVSLGDLVGYYSNPNECVRIVRERGVESVAGNHDRAAAGLKEPTWFSDTAKRGIAWTREHLTAESTQFLAALPLVALVDQRFRIVHGALHPRPNEDIYLTSAREVSASFRALMSMDPNVNLCFFGHTHRSVAYELSDGTLSKIEDEEVALRRGAHYLLNPGSVGQSRDSDPRASFLIFDAERARVRFHRVAYDVAACWRKAGAAGLLVEGSPRGRSVHWIDYSVQAAKNVVRRAWPRG